MGLSISLRLGLPVPLYATGSADWALVLMALTLVRPSSGMRIVVLMLLIVGAALAGMTLGFRDLMSLFSGAS